MEVVKYNLQRVRTTADLKVSPSPVDLFAVQIVSDGVGAADAKLIDGHNDGGENVMDLACAQGSSWSQFFPCPVPFNKGLFIDIGSNVTSVFVLIGTERE